MLIKRIGGERQKFWRPHAEVDNGQSERDGGRDKLSVKPLLPFFRQVWMSSESGMVARWSATGRIAYANLVQTWTRFMRVDAGQLKHQLRAFSGFMDH
jgi:hypothetical protein